MRPFVLEFQAFGPYAGYERIDFESLADKGLFLICGETGSGKTMLLDAMTFALYGMSSGNSRNDFEAMRCTNVDFDTPTFVKFIFENGGDVYLFERRLEPKRKHFSIVYNVMKKDSLDQWKTLLENPRERDLNRKAEELLGLDYHQFRQVIVLPQGQFEKLLTSGSDEKEKILSSIFGEYKWQAIAERMFEDASERMEKLRSRKESMENSLREEGCRSMEELSGRISQIKAEMETLKKEYETANYEEEQKTLQEALLLANRFGDLHAQERKKQAFDAGQEHRDELAIMLERAQRAEKVRQSIVDLQTMKRNVEQRRKDLEEAVGAEQQYREMVLQICERLEEHLKRKGEMDANRNLQASYANRRADYEGISEAGKKCEKTKKELLHIQKQVKQVKEEYDSYIPKIESLRTKYEAENERQKQMLDAYIHGISGILAKDLTEGEKCPVCGNTHHPQKAAMTAESVTKEAVDKQKEKVDQGYRALQDCISMQEKAKKILDEVLSQEIAAKTEYAGAEATFQSKMANRIEGIDSLEQLMQKVEEISRKVDSYEKTKEDLEHRKQEADQIQTQMKTKIQTAGEELKKAEKQCKQAEQILETKLEENHFVTPEEAKKCFASSEDMKAMQTEMTEFDASKKACMQSIDSLMNELSGREEPDEEFCRKRIDEVNRAMTEYATEVAKRKQECDRLSAKQKSLLTQGKGLLEAIKEAEEDVRFAKKLRGDSGTSLQRYVLGIMFSSVVSAANKMLELVHDGRYRLYRSDDKVQGKNKRGLELKVHDRYSDEKEGRFVNTLSGGEKFLVSLALSIGMSTVAQRSGIKMEALFIDEGFGSLDDNSIEDAMNVLHTIQQSNGLVGIISHVQIVRDRIPTKLIVEKTGGNSHISQAIG